MRKMSARNVGTIRKAGVTTGCRYCSNDGQCDLQDVVEKTGVTEVDYPVYYRHLQVKKADPFSQIVITIFA